MSKAAGSIVTFNRYVPATTKDEATNVPTPATVLRDPGDGTLDIAFLNPAKATLLSSVDWRDAFDRVTSVPKQDSVESHHGWEETTGAPLASLSDAQSEITKLKGMLSQSADLEAGANKLRDFIATNYPDAVQSGQSFFDCVIALLDKPNGKKPKPIASGK